MGMFLRRGRRRADSVLVNMSGSFSSNSAYVMIAGVKYTSDAELKAPKDTEIYIYVRTTYYYVRAAIYLNSEAVASSAEDLYCDYTLPVAPYDTVSIVFSKSTGEDMDDNNYTRYSCFITTS